MNEQFDSKAFPDSLVVTTLGEVAVKDLEVKMLYEENAEVWVVARECRYIGKDHPDKVNELVKRDVWVTIKRGQAVKAESNL